MSGNAQLAQTGLPTLVIGGVAYPVGGWMALAAVAVLLGALLVFKFGFRRTVPIDAAQAESANEPTKGNSPRRHGK